VKSGFSFWLRLLIGSVLWTMGLLALAHLIFRVVVLRHLVLSTRDLIIVALALQFALAGIVAVRSGLTPFHRLRSRLLEVRDGRHQTITGLYPSEVQPLVDDLNSLLLQRDHAVSRAQAKARDLAHGLKTPLAILAQEADRAKRKGHAEPAATIGLQVERMRRQIEYHLAQARAAGTGNTPGVRSSVKESAEALSRTLQRLCADRQLSIHVEASGEDFVRVQREDLDEILGNVLDRKLRNDWSCMNIARSEILSPRHPMRKFSMPFECMPDTLLIIFAKAVRGKTIRPQAPRRGLAKIQRVLTGNHSGF
jgi:hypothetical protein